MRNMEIVKSKPHELIDIIDYVPDSVVCKTIIRKTTGNISIIAIASGETLAEKTSPFDTFIQIIEGTAHVIIDSELIVLTAGQGIIIPAHTANAIKANQQFKMISTVIKSGYEQALI